MTPTSGLKRLGIAVAAVVAALAGALAVAPLLVRPDAVREAVQAEIRYATGLEPALRGGVSIASFPSGSASFADIALGDDAGGRPALTADRLLAKLRLLPLLVGRVEVAEITLIRPSVFIEFGSDGSSNWTGILETLARTLDPNRQSERPMSFSEIRLVDGTVSIREREHDASERLEAVELSLAWPAISQSFGATGHFVWRDERIDAAINIGDFFAALTGQRSGLRARLSGQPFKLAFDGHVSHKPTLKIEGALSADGPSLRRAVQWAGRRSLPGGGFGRFALKAKTQVVDSTIALSNVGVELDGNAAEGVLTVIGDRRPVVQGTLAAEAVDATPYVSQIQLGGLGERDWNSKPIDLDGFTSLDLDLRLSASQVTLPGAKLGRTALGVSLRGGRLGIAIGEAQAFGGVLKGSLALAKAGAGAEVKAQLQFANVELDACLGALLGTRRLEGRGNVALSLDSSGGDVDALVRGLKGTGALTATRGALNGINIEQALRRLERRPLSGIGEFRTGRTPFETLAVGVEITNGTATVQSVKLDGAAVRLALGGSASIPARSLDLQGVASLVGTAKEPFELPFVVHGRWDDPVMLPDVQSLMRHSGAAAPLLDAVRSGRSREAVRSAIEQLTRGGAEPAAPSAAPSAESPGAAR